MFKWSRWRRSWRRRAIVEGPRADSCGPVAGTLTYWPHCRWHQHRGKVIFGEQQPIRLALIGIDATGYGCSLPRQIIGSAEQVLPEFTLGLATERFTPASGEFSPGNDEYPRHQSSKRQWWLVGNTSDINQQGEPTRQSV